MSSNSIQTPATTTTTGGTKPANIDASMLACYIHDTSSLQDRLLIRAMAEDSQSSQKGVGYSGPKDSKL
ncbi:unnamed protein product [Fusarium graminearum]|uniref:Chromosome 2, complete genome n=1 Tax=Gibberella zeae (strain ATCC MYA-4620 / CBS 123657 / FGSC 9075 / NRRL 31084 / PH-1) TaxID=229533 RepID=A0A0E0S7C4_GIBZE|nr:hypothetical protein FG05_30450 [Fusarium graminearum]CAG1975248.1 unnamed protein product [Fusarium graminearum]CEF79399.1 unnamed protein product [Fusarium graminearum]